MKTFIVASFLVMASAFAAEIVPVTSIPYASYYNTSAVSASFDIDMNGSARVLVFGHLAGSAGNDPERGVEVFTVSVPGLDLVGNSLELNGTVCALKSGYALNLTGNCKFDVQTKNDTIEVSLIVK